MAEDSLGCMQVKLRADRGNQRVIAAHMNLAQGHTRGFERQAFGPPVLEKESMSNWLVDKLIPSIMRSEVKKSSVPEGLWHKCPSCDAVLYRPELEKTLDVCPKCNHHMRIGARARIDLFLDAEGRAERKSVV